jgi:GNAT superfamily N-acetyltransferase
MEAVQLHPDLLQQDQDAQGPPPIVMDLLQAEDQERQAQRPSGQEIYEHLESKNWAPWLRYSPEELDAQAQVFPEGQMFIRDEAGELVVALSTNRINWDGHVESAPSWDVMAGPDATYANTYDSSGNTLVLMSMNVDPSHQGRGLAGSIFEKVRGLAQEQDIERIAADFRPIGFGAYKRESGKFDINEYADLCRNDGQLRDPWLRSVTRQGAEILRSHDRAMVVRATADEVDQWSQSFNPNSWWEVTDDQQKDQLFSAHQPFQDLRRVDQVLECGETGTWYVDRESNEAVYVESNIWAEVPKEAPVSDVVELPAGDHYHLPERQVRALEREMVSAVKTEFSEPDVYAVWVAPDHRFADAVRTLEARQFPEMPDVVNDSVEEHSTFLVLVDTRNNEDRIIHCTRLSGISLNEQTEERSSRSEESSGYIVIDEAIGKGELSLEDFKQFCEQQNIDADTCISVETNFRVGERVPERDGLRISDIGYATFFRKALAKSTEASRSVLFASINIGTRKSLGTIGLQHVPLIENQSQDSAEKDYELVAVPGGGENYSILTMLAQFVTVKETIFEY